MSEGTTSGPNFRLKRTGVGFGLGLVLSACAIVGPLTDSDLSGASRMACVDIGAPAPAAAASTEWTPGSTAPAAAAPACFVVVAQDAQGQRTPWTGGAIEPGRALIAAHNATGQCAGVFTHLTVTGSSSVPGRMDLATYELFGRAGHNREVRWSEGFEGRTYSLASISSTAMNPGGARISVSEGSFEPRSVCFRSY